MKHKRALTIGTLTLILIILAVLWGNGVFEKKESKWDPPTIDPGLISAAKVSESLDYLIFFEEQADLSGAYELPWEERGWYVYDALVAQAQESQKKVRKYLDKRDVTYQSFWIDNVIAVKDSSARTFNGLFNFLEIDSLKSVPVITLENPFGTLNDEAVNTFQEATPNLVHIHADDAWMAGYSGEGFVVGSIDTGVRYTHEALKDQYRGYSEEGYFSHNFNWWDAVNGSIAPYDDHGHGSHTTGIMVGADPSGNAIGVAPGAKWMACKAIDKNGSGLGWDFLECGQFMLAPWDLEGQGDNPSLRPHVVNNSWGSCSQTYASWFEGAIDAWHAAGIYPVFANGNASNCGYDSPPGLGTVGNPARSYHVTAVGSTGTDDGAYAPHSNWGPTDSEDILNGNGYPWIKPQVVAPGVNIRSAVSAADDAYANWGGTSMSAPHVSGLVTLMWQAGDCLMGDYVQTENLIEKSASPIPYATDNGDEGPENVPNHATGWGEIDVLAAIGEAQAYCGFGDQMMSLTGTVRDGSGHGYPLYAKLSFISDHHNPTVYTDPFNGTFRVEVYKDTVYDLTITSEINGYQSINESQLVFSDKNALRDYSLQVSPDCSAPGYFISDLLGIDPLENQTAEGCMVQPGGVLAGLVTDAATGLAAEEAVVSRAGIFTVTQRTPYDPNLADGFYWTFQPSERTRENIVVSVSKDFYRTEEVEVSMTQDAVTQKDFAIRHYKDILLEFLSNFWERIVDFFLMIWEKILAFFERSWESVRLFVSVQWAQVPEFTGMVWERVGDFFTSLWASVMMWIIPLFQN